MATILREWFLNPDDSVTCNETEWKAMLDDLEKKDALRCTKKTVNGTPCGYSDVAIVHTSLRD